MIEGTGHDNQSSTANLLRRRIGVGGNDHDSGADSGADWAAGSGAESARDRSRVRATSARSQTRGQVDDRPRSLQERNCRKTSRASRSSTTQVTAAAGAVVEHIVAVTLLIRIGMVGIGCLTPRALVSIRFADPRRMVIGVGTIPLVIVAVIGMMDTPIENRSESSAARFPGHNAGDANAGTVGRQPLSRGKRSYPI